jgi:putative transposase
MSYHPEIHHRRSVRLRSFDYSRAGGYFITICAFQRECIFGEVAEATVRLNEMGEIVREEWLKSGEIRAEIYLDEFVVMPNHFHAIVLFGPEGPHGIRPPLAKLSIQDANSPLRKPKSLGALVGGFKSAVTRRISELTGNSGSAIWQRNYHEHVIRNEKDLSSIRQYIIDNPIKWEFDENHPGNMT